MAIRLIFMILVFTSSPAVFGDYPFRNTSLPWKERVDDLVSRLTFEEVVLQLSRGGAGEFGGPAPPIRRLGIWPYQWNNECLRGDAMAGNATSFPEAIGLAASFSDKLIFEVANATAYELRAKNNDYQARGIYHDHTGLSCFSPVINIMRHPLWGRNQETYGEDPHLTGTFATKFVEGLQGSGRYIKANAGCKHFDAYAGPESIPVSRLNFSADVSDRDWRLTFLPAFKKCVEAGSYSLMCSYNSINGIPACANKRLLTDILRKEWKFKGYVISDEGALEFNVYTHHFFNNYVDSAAASINAGTNIELSGGGRYPVYSYLPEAVKKKMVAKELLYERAKPLFYTRMRLGEFDPPSMNPYTKLDLSLIQCPTHRELTLRAALMSFVMLKNTNGFLPLRKLQIDVMGIVGPFANDKNVLFGDYAPNADKNFVITPFEGLRTLAEHVNVNQGCIKDPSCAKLDNKAVLDAVKNTNLTIICLGTGTGVEAENRDRRNMDLPGKQLDLMKLAIDNSHGDVILLIFSAGPLDIRYAEDHPKVKAIFQCWYPAQATGDALRMVLTGQGLSSNPAGRLPYTWYASMDQVLPMVNYTMVNRTYRYFEGDPLYPFGYGLSYTTFAYRSLTVQTSPIKAGQDQKFKVSVRNTGKVDGDEVVQVYISWNNYKALEMPQLQLVHFKRVFLKAQQQLTVMGTIKAEQLAVWDDVKGFVVKPGVIKVFAGGQQPYQKKKVPSNVVSTQFTIM